MSNMKNADFNGQSIDKRLKFPFERNKKIKEIKNY